MGATARVIDLGSRTARTAHEPARPAALQRSSGRAAVGFKRRGDRTVLADLFQSGCCKARLPAPEPGRMTEAVLINTAGGLTDGDRVATEAVWGEDTAAIVTTQAAERIYLSRGEPASVRTVLDVRRGAVAAWLPQETILFDGGRVDRRIDIDMAEGGTLVACESLVLGRAAMGERVSHGSVGDAWRLRCAGRLVFADGLRLSGRIDETLARPAVARGATCIATLLVAGPMAASCLAPARSSLEAARCLAGASVVGPVMTARLVGASALELRRDLARMVEAVLGTILARPGASLLPRVWRL